MKSFLLFVLILSSNFVIASSVGLRVISAVKVQQFTLGVGSRVELNFVDENRRESAVFLGRMANHPNFGNEILFLMENKLVLMIDQERLKTSIARSRMQPAVSTIDQMGETCAAYAMFHFWQQTNEMKISSNRNLVSQFSGERLKIQFLEESLARYYLEKKSRLSLIMADFGKRFGFRCEERYFVDSADAIEYVMQKSLAGKPVMMEFNIGSRMFKSPYLVHDFETNVSMDASLWMPRRIGERKSGGHVVVAAAGFMNHGRNNVLVLDSNWNEPRVWSLEEAFGGKTAIDEMAFYSCESTGP